MNSDNIQIPNAFVYEQEQREQLLDLGYDDEEIELILQSFWMPPQGAAK